MAEYVPSTPILRELARAELREPSSEPLALATGMRRGLIDWRGWLTDAGRDVLNREVRKAECKGGLRAQG